MLNIANFGFYCAENEVNVWDEGADSEKNIRVDPKKGVTAATFNKLVERLTSERDHGQFAKHSDLETWITKGPIKANHAQSCLMRRFP